MAIKHFTFSFKLDAKDLLEYVTERNVAVEIQAFGTKPKPKLETPPKPLALPAPTQFGRQGMQNVLVAFVLAHKEGVSMAGLKALFEQSGYSQKSLSNAIYNARTTGLIKRTGNNFSAKFYATAKAVKLTEVVNG
jgi:hypothetical protein